MDWNPRKKLKTILLFTDGDTTLRVIAENTPTATNIGTPVNATDEDEDLLTYSLSGTYASAFDIDPSTGQLITKAELDYEVMSVYPLTVTVSDGALTDTITVVIGLIDRLETEFVTMTVPVSERTAQVRDAIVDAVPNISNAEDVTADHLAAIMTLDLRGEGITELKTGDFTGLTGLTNLNLFNNMLTRLPIGTFSGLTSLTTLRLGRNLIDPLPLVVSLQQVVDNQYKAVLSTAAPFNINLSINVTDGNISGNSTEVIISKGNIYSNTFTIIPTSTLLSPIVDIDTLPTIPVGHYGYVLAKSVVCNRTPQIAEAIAAVVPNVDDCNNVTEVDLATITTLNLKGMGIKSLTSDDLAGMFSLASLDLSDNELSTLPEGIFSVLDSLQMVDLSGNTIDPLPIGMTLERLETDELQVFVPTGAPFDISIPLLVENGSIDNEVTSITILKGNVKSEPFNITRTPGTIGPVTATMPNITTLPEGHLGYILMNTNDMSLGIEEGINVAPEFSDGENVTLSIEENSETGINIGTAITATDANEDTLIYSLGGVDVESFDLDTTTGQLKTKAPLDYETQTTYTVMITVSDGELTDTIEVTINVTDVEEVPEVIEPPEVVEPPVVVEPPDTEEIPMTDPETGNTFPLFTEGDSTTRGIAENTAPGTNIGAAISATDTDTDDILTYSLSGTDADSFKLDSQTGQLVTNDFLDYEIKSSYSLTITVSDGNDGSDSIAVTILITDVDERATNSVPTFTEGDEASRAVDENTALGVNLGDPFTATDEDDDTLTYLLGGVDAGSFTLDSESGQLKTNEPLDFERKPSYSVTISVSDGQGGFDKIAVSITVTDVAELGDNTVPVFTEGELATRTIEENTDPGVNIGDPVSATDVDEDVLTYGITGTDAAVFSFDNTSGQIQTNQPLDFETQPTYVVTIAVSDGRGGSASITVTINVTDVFELPANNPPVFNEGSETTRSISENSPSGISVGSAVAATDLDGDNLSYTLIGPDAESFNISSSTGQISTSILLDFESQSEYSLIVTVSDGNDGSASIPVTIFITNVNEVPSFNDGDSTTRTIAENTDPDINIGSPVAAFDEDGDTLTYTLSGPDADSFSIELNTGQLLTKEPLDFETKAAYSLTVAVSDPDGEGDSISVTISIIDLEEAVENIHAPVFNDGQSTTRSIAENTPSNENIGDPVRATDQDSATLTYQLSGSGASHFSISGATGQLKTNSPLDREETASYSVNVIASDGQLSTSIAVTIEITDINEPPRFPNLGTSIYADENTPPGTPIGSPIEAIDNDLNTTLVYSISDYQDGSHFDINSETGQLITKQPLNFERKSIRLLFVAVSDGEFTVRISVSVYLVDLNDPPTFNEGEETTRTIDENTPSGVAIGGAVAATDVDQGLSTNAPDVLTYTLGGVDASSFTIDSSSGQISTSAALDHETKETYSVTVTVTDNAEPELPTDPGELTDEIAVTITVADVNEAPVFAEGDDTVRSIDENTASGVAIGSTISAFDVDSGDVLTYTMAGASASSFSIDSSTGQIRTSAPLNFEVTNTFSVTVTVTDNGGPDGPSGVLLTDTISVTININDINDAPVFTEGDNANRNIDENTSSGITIGSVVGATDEDTNPVDTLSYSLDSSTDAGAFSINSSTGQISTSGALDHETQDSYSFSVIVSDQRSPSLTDSISMTIAINDVNEAPVFTDGASTIRSVDENSASGTNIGSIVGATDVDRDPSDTLTYSLGGTDSGSFNIDSNIGQLKTSEDLNFEVKNSYSVTITVSDNESPALTDSIDVTITINDVNDNPVFSQGDSTTRSVDENTASGTNIGSVVGATDEDTLPSADTLTYSLGGTDSGSFSIVSTTGQLQTSSPLTMKQSHSIQLL